VRVDVARVVDGASFGAVHLWVIVIGFLCMTTDGFDLQSMSFTAPAVAVEWTIRRELLGPVLAASIVGMAVGSVLLGWIGDRIGRKRSFGLCFALMCLGSIGSYLSRDLLQLTISRLITGLALGGATPLATALISEWTPKSWRALAIAIVIVAVPAGGMIGAAVSERIIPTYGWRAVFLVGALVPLLCLVVTWLEVPESPHFLARSPTRRVQLAVLLNQIVRDRPFTGEEEFVATAPRTTQRNELFALLQFPYLSTTVILWITFSLNTLALYGFVNWLPTIMASTGISLVTALGSAAWFNIGGVLGAICGSVLISWLGSRLVGSMTALMAMIAVFVVGMIVASIHSEGSPWLLPAVLICGMCLNGTQVFLYAVAANAYPTPIRATGVGCAAAVSRVGGVGSSVVGSAMFLLGLSVTTYFDVLAAVAGGVMLGFVFLRGQISRTA